jgi:hypothetical protein
VAAQAQRVGSSRARSRSGRMRSVASTGDLVPFRKGAPCEDSAESLSRQNHGACATLPRWTRATLPRRSGLCSRPSWLAAAISAGVSAGLRAGRDPAFGLWYALPLIVVSIATDGEWRGARGRRVDARRANQDRSDVRTVSANSAQFRVNAVDRSRTSITTRTGHCATRASRSVTCPASVAARTASVPRP